LFQPNEKKDIITSTASWLAMVGVLAGLTFLMGPVTMLKLYGVPYFVRATFLLFSPNFCKKII
jgi:acyl-lipid omega-3 desaturase